MTSSPFSGQVEGHNACTDVRVAGVTVATVAHLRCSHMSEKLREAVIQQPMALNFCASYVQTEEYNSYTDVPSAGIIGAIAAPFKCNVSNVRSEAEIRRWPMLSILESRLLVKGREPWADQEVNLTVTADQEVNFTVAADQDVNCMITKFTFYTIKCSCTRLDLLVFLT